MSRTTSVPKREPTRSGAARRLEALEVVSAADDIPEPIDERAAAAYYSTHGFAAEALDGMPDASEEFAGGFRRTRPVSIRFPEPMLVELRAVAARKSVAYQALIKIWLDERLQRERRGTARLQGS